MKNFFYVPLATILFSSLVTLSGCSPKIDNDQVVSALQEVGQLTTNRLILTRICADKGNRLLKIFGDKKIAITMTAYVGVGLDMDDFHPEKTSINKSSKSILLVLPPIKRLAFNCPLDEIQVEYKSVGLLRSDYSMMERQEIYNACESDIMESIDNEIAMNPENYKVGAVVFFDALLKNIGFENVQIEFENYE